MPIGVYKRKKGLRNSGMFKKGNISWNKGKKIGYNKKQADKIRGRKLTEEWKKKISIALKGKKKPFGFGFGKHHSEKTKEKISKMHKGKHLNPKTEFKKGHKLSSESLNKMSEKHRGEKSWFWKGGISFEPYSLDWTSRLRKYIRKRDNYTCQICNKKQNNKRIAVHHINYNKKDCRPENLIALCQSCHTKTNFRRLYWTWQLMIFMKLYNKLGGLDEVYNIGQ